MWFATGPPAVGVIGIYDFPPPEGVGGIEALEVDGTLGYNRLARRLTRIRDEINDLLP